VDSKITIDGQVNLRDETLDIFIESRPKDPSPFSANQPMHVGGPLLSPSVNPAPGRTENEALGWLLALAGALPFLDIGGEEDSPCGSLIAEAKEAAAARPQWPAGDAPSCGP
jgi:AsmA family protein